MFSPVIAELDAATALAPTESEVSAVRCSKTPPLSGVVRPSGSKNVGLKVLAAMPLFRTPVTLRGVPRNNQVRYILAELRSLGIDVSVESDDQAGFGLTIHAQSISRQYFADEEIRWCRHMFLLAVAVLLRTGYVSVPVPGYSHYGPRPINGQLGGLKQLGATVSPVAHGRVEIELPTRRLVGKDIYLPFPSNAVTEALLWAAVAAEGRTTIHGSSHEPETLELCGFFRRAGARVAVSSSSITVHGVGLDDLILPDAFTIVPDRIEIATLGAAVAIARGAIRIQGVEGDHLAAVRATLTSLGTSVEQIDDSWLLRADGRPCATDVATGPFPGFPTDGLGPYIAALSLAEGVSVVHERLWFNRLSLPMELKRMGADIDIPSAQLAVIRGVRRFTGASVIGTDPRAAAALILAGLQADGETIVTGIDLLDNAYDSLVSKLQGLGARIQRTTVPSSQHGLSHPTYGRLEAF